MDAMAELSSLNLISELDLTIGRANAETLILSIVLLIFLLLMIFVLDKSDIPYIQKLPAVPSVPIFGSLFQLGSEHPKRLAELSKQYGPVFQIRLGNRVRLILDFIAETSVLTAFF